MNIDLHRLYRSLELEPGASLDEVKQARTELLKLWNSERWANDPTMHQRAVDRVKEIDEAHDALVEFLTKNPNASQEMRKPVKSAGRLAGIVAGLLVVGTIIGLVVARNAKNAAEPEPDPIYETSVSTDTEPGQQPGKTGNGTKANQGLPMPAGKPPVQTWEDKVNQIIASPVSPEEKGRLLLSMLPQIPKTGQAQAVQHISNLISDDDYPKLGKYFTNPSTQSDVLDVLMADLLTRPNSVKLPLLLEAAVNPSHPKSAEAKNIMKTYLEQDYGDNPEMWRQKLAEWFRKNPD